MRGEIIWKRIKKCAMHPSFVSLGTAHMYHNDNLDVFCFSKIKVLHLEMVVLGLYWFPAFDESSMNIPRSLLFI